MWKMYGVELLIKIISLLCGCMLTVNLHDVVIYYRC